MRLWLARRGKSLIPTDEVGEAWVKRLQLGECAEFEVRRPRSVQWNRMYWGLCRCIGENQDPPRDEDSIDAELRIRAGHFEVILFDGLEVRVPKRIAFDKMDSDAWEGYWARVEQAVSETFGEHYLRSEAAWRTSAS